MIKSSDGTVNQESPVSQSDQFAEDRATIAKLIGKILAKVWIQKTPPHQKEADYQT